MLEVKKQQAQPEYDPSIEDDDLDWLDLGANSDFYSPRKAHLSLITKEVTL